MAEPDPQTPTAPEPVASEAAAAPVGLISTADILAAQPARANREPGPEALPGEPLTVGQKGKKGKDGKVIVRTQWPVDSFDSGIEGIPIITSAGVELDSSKADELLAAVASAGTTLEVVS
jgi:hypothetical protein